jgi:hypothetical protein
MIGQKLAYEKKLFFEILISMEIYKKKIDSKIFMNELGKIFLCIYSIITIMHFIFGIWLKKNELLEKKIFSFILMNTLI